MSSASDFWTPARCDLLTELWASGATARDVANVIGCTRNAVIGKRKRLGLARKERKTVKPRTGYFHTAVVRNVVDEHETTGLAYAPTPETPIEDRLIPVEQRRTLLQLSADVCHWPVGDPREPDFFFCGAPVRSGRPYCGAHCRVAYSRASGM